MTHRQIYTTFKMNYTYLVTQPLKEWFKNGKNSIRLRDISGEDYVFTYIDSNNWSFETIKHFVERLRGRTKM